MSGDLNEFLRQAAMRREARKRAGNSSSAPAGPSRQPVSSSEMEILQPIPVEQRHLTPQLPAGDHLSGNVAKADQQREAHLNEVFGQKAAPLDRAAKKKQKAKAAPNASKAASVKSGATTGMSDSLESDAMVSAAIDHQGIVSKELFAFLQNPDSLRMAFIASEIFARKFQ